MTNPIAPTTIKLPDGQELHNTPENRAYAKMVERNMRDKGITPVVSYDPAPSSKMEGERERDAPNGFNLTDMGNAERLVKEYGDGLRYCYEQKCWLKWNGHVWEEDSGAKINLLAKLTVRGIYREAANEPDEKQRKLIADHAKRCESNQHIQAMIMLAQSEPGIPVKVTELDTDPWLFNCLNGTIDLRSGQLLPHRNEDLLTVIAPIEYDPEAQCPLWLSFLDWAMGGNAELVGYLQRAVGYSLTGEIKSQVLFFLYGLGNNGKSTFTIVIRKMTAGYGEKVGFDLFMLKDRNAGGPKEALANLRGKRFVMASEPEEGRKLAISLIKDMTGGESIRADRKYEHEVEYQPTHKIWLVGNHKPVIPDTTLSIWRRVKLIPFTVTIPTNEIDDDLPLKLEAELPGIFAWAVRGCQDWQQNGLQEPDAVSVATAGYRRDQDILGDFLEDCCTVEPSASIPKAELKTEYLGWCERTGTDLVTAKTFKARLCERGIVEGRVGKARTWKGIREKTVADGDISDKTSGDLATEVTLVTRNPIKSLREESQEKFMENHVISRHPDTKPRQKTSPNSTPEAEPVTPTKRNDEGEV